MPTPAHDGDASAGSRRRLIGCSADRTLATVPGDDGRFRLRKVFETGSIADAERERRAADVLAGPGIVACLESGREIGSDRPFLEFPLLEGADLESLVRRSGPLPMVRALRVALDLATVLARIATTRTAEAPRGFVHGDVKPSNVFVGPDDSVWLVDLEHVTAAGHAVTGHFSGGTLGFAPPEAHVGAAPDAPFDVFGFGRTIRFALDATSPGRRSRNVAWIPDALQMLLDACCAEDPASRPSWEMIQAALTRLIEDHGTAAERRLDGIRLALLAGEDGTARHLARNLPEGDLRTRVDRAADRARRLSARIRDAEGSLPLHARARGLSAVLRRFPAHEAALREARRLLTAIAEAITSAPERIKELTSDGGFGAARSLLDTTRNSLEFAAHIGRIPVSHHTPDTVPGIARDPQRVLDLLARDLDARMAGYREFSELLAGAELAGDLDRAREVVLSASKVYGGASEVTAALKERVHLLEFAASRIGGSQGALDECARQLDLADLQVDLTPLREIVSRCERSAADTQDTHCRGLLGTLDDLVGEHDAPDTLAARARDVLRTSLERLTAEAWRVLRHAETLLESSPIPIRPLSADVSRVDRLDVAGGLIDSSDGSRTELLDALETIRIRVERARAKRDHLARGAEESMASGHLTTALFEMERVANQFEETSAGAELSDRYERAKQLKREIESNLEANHALAASFQDLEDRPSGSAERIEVLRERERALDFLCRHVREHRREPYEKDRDAVRFQLFEEADAAGRSRHDGSPSEAARSEVAAQVARELGILVPPSGWDAEQLSHARQTIEGWRVRGAQRRVSTSRPEPRRGWIGIVALVLIGFAGLYGASVWARAEADLAQLSRRLELALRWPNSPHQVDESMRRLGAFVDGLEVNSGGPDAVSRACRDLLDAVREGRSQPDLERLRSALRVVEDAIDASPTPVLIERYGQAAHCVACVWATLGGIDDALIRGHLDATESLRVACPPLVAKRIRDGQ